MQAALERVRDVAESWFELSETQRQQLRAEWNGERGGDSPRVVDSKGG